MATIDDQLALHDAAALCSYLILRPGKLPDEEDPPIPDEDADPGLVVARLKPALELAWPAHPERPEAIAPFLDDAATRFEEKATEMAGAKASCRRRR